MADFRLGIFGNISTGGLADNWVRDNWNPNFSGSLADLIALKNQNCSDCANYVHSKAPLTSRATAYGLCQTRINNKYADIQNYLEQQQKVILDSENNAAKAASDYYANSFSLQSATGMSGKTIGVFVMVIIIIIIVYIFLK